MENVGHNYFGRNDIPVKCAAKRSLQQCHVQYDLMISYCLVSLAVQAFHLRGVRQGVQAALRAQQPHGGALRQPHPQVRDLQEVSSMGA